MEKEDEILYVYTMLLNIGLHKERLPIETNIIIKLSFKSINDAIHNGGFIKLFYKWNHDN